jgi:hypothetical protein
VRKTQSAGEFLGDDRVGVVAEQNVKFVVPGAELVEEALGVKGAAGSGDGDDDSHAWRLTEIRAFARTMAAAAAAGKSMEGWVI